MKYAVISLGGKQFKIKEGDTFKLERQKKLDINVLLYVDGDKVEVGTPSLSGVKVDAKIVREERGPKIRVARFKSKSRYRKVKGHKQPLSVVEIVKISKKSATTKPKVATAAKKSKVKPAKKTVAKSKPTTKKKATVKKKKEVTKAK
jgi:large subunit ribosomal protein L21